MQYSSLRAAYLRCQVRIKELEQEVAMSNRRLAKNKPAAINKSDEEIKMHAKKFIVLHELFLPSDDSFFSQPRPTGVDLWSKDRYKDEASKTKAILAEVYHSLPDHLHDFISGHSRFDEIVSPRFSEISW